MSCRTSARQEQSLRVKGLMRSSLTGEALVPQVHDLALRLVQDLLLEDAGEE